MSQKDEENAIVNREEDFTPHLANEGGAFHHCGRGITATAVFKFC